MVLGDRKLKGWAEFSELRKVIFFLNLPVKVFCGRYFKAIKFQMKLCVGAFFEMSSSITTKSNETPSIYRVFNLQQYSKPDKKANEISNILHFSCRKYIIFNRGFYVTCVFMLQRQWWKFIRKKNSRKIFSSFYPEGSLESADLVFSYGRVTQNFVCSSF